MKKLFAAISLAFLLLAQTDDTVNARIRKEEAERSQIMRTLHMLTDRYGPRLTGSPNHENAAKWLVEEMTRWGFKNAHLEPWTFGHVGWLNERAAGHIVSPVKDNLTFEVQAWTPSTNGAVTASVVQLEIPQGPLASQPPAATDATAGGAAPNGRGGRGGPARLGPTQEELNQWMAANKEKIAGKMVLINKAAVIPVNFNPPAKRRSDDQVRQQFDPNSPNAGRGGRGGRGGAGAQEPARLSANAVTEQVDAWLRANGAVMRINDAAMGHGVIRAFQNRKYDPVLVVPNVVLRNEDFGRIQRLMADGEEVTLEFNILNRTYPQGVTSYNVIGEIPGTDKADEVVMLGGHLDSWHSATGATDNAAGCSMILEAARLIQALGLKPRRTIRVALWAAEEQGLLGSREYVSRHYFDAATKTPKPDHANVQAYFNLDNGTGRILGIWGQGNAAAMKSFERWGQSLKDIGWKNVSPRSVSQTDHVAFENAGLPGFQFIQERLEYNSRTHHSNMDTFDHVQKDDVIQQGAVAAIFAWYAANSPDRLPRKATK